MIGNRLQQVNGDIKHRKSVQIQLKMKKMFELITKLRLLLGPTIDN